MASQIQVENDQNKNKCTSQSGDCNQLTEISKGHRTSKDSCSRHHLSAWAAIGSCGQPMGGARAKRRCFSISLNHLHFNFPPIQKKET